MLIAAPTLAHEFWIAPKKYQVEKGEMLVADLKNGEEFAGITLGYFERQIVRSDHITSAGVRATEGRTGDVPALTLPPQPEGLVVLVHQTTPSSLKYTEWEKFVAFAAHKDFPDIAARHDALGAPRTGFREVYGRFAKALVAIGDGAGADAPTGMETEFVAMTNPYDANFTDEMKVQLLYRNTPRADAQVEVFERAPEGAVTITLTRTDAAGMATVPVKRGHDYLLDGVVLRPYAGDMDAVWETLWAALTFRVPN